MSGTLVVVLSLAVAGLVALSVRRIELGREPGPTACSRVIDDVFANGAAATTADSVLLARLLEHRDECIGDAAYVNQARRLMVNTQRVTEARTLLEEAERRGTFAPDELKAQVAWVDLAAAHLAWTKDMEPEAKELYAKAVATADELRVRWPEWLEPYLLLDEAGRAAWANPSAAPSIDYFQVGLATRRRVLSGAFARNLSDWQPAVFAFVVATVGMLGLCAGISGLWAMREMTSMTTSDISAAQPGYVELAGTLHVLPNAGAVVGPQSREPGVWYETSTNSGSKGAQTQYQRSAQPFALRDATGEAVIEPAGMTVRTRHSTTKFSGGAGLSSRGRASERLLKENDVAYVLGELSIARDQNGATVRRVAVAENGRRLLVSNLSQSQLLVIERVWLWVGTAVFLTAAIVLPWAYYQRYHVRVAPARVAAESGAER